jgi:hypothetical protein
MKNDINVKLSWVKLYQELNHAGRYVIVLVFHDLLCVNGLSAT